MTLIVDIKVSLMDDSRVLFKNIQGGINVQFLLNSKVEDWLDRFAPGWVMLRGDKWNHIPLWQICLPYRCPVRGFLPLDPVSFVFQTVDHALLFKLTWG